LVFTSSKYGIIPGECLTRSRKRVLHDSDLLSTCVKPKDDVFVTLKQSSVVSTPAPTSAATVALAPSPAVSAGAAPAASKPASVSPAAARVSASAASAVSVPMMPMEPVAVPTARRKLSGPSLADALPASAALCKKRAQAAFDAKNFEGELSWFPYRACVCQYMC